MKRLLTLIIIIAIMFTGCSNDDTLSENSTNDLISVTDSSGHVLELQHVPQKVVALTASFADIWLLAGGELAGVSNDALSENNIPITEGTELIGTVKDPNIEAILSMEPDLVILSADISSHLEAATIFDQANIPYFVAKVETFSDYLLVLDSFTDITGRKELYKENGTDISKEIASHIGRVPEQIPPRVLFLRAFSSGVKAKSRDNATCDILKDLGTINIAEQNDSLLEDLSMEVIIEENPDFIFVVTMGDDSEKAMTSLEDSFISNPAWNNLDAVKNDRFIILPKDLYHYKPNARWGEAYEYLFEIIYPDSK